MADDNNFRINTSDYLGISHSEYKNKLLQLSLTQADNYFKLREQVLKTVKENAIKQLYNTFYYAMTSGTKGTTAANGDWNPAENIAAGAFANADTFFVPNYPKQKVTEFALSAARTMDALCEECVEILMPINYQDLAVARLSRKGEARMAGVGAP